MARAAKTGVDDYLAAGGTVRDLRLLARRFEPREIGEIRLSRDEKLRAAVEALWGTWRRMPARRQGECTTRSAVRVLIDEAQRSGKPVDGGLQVVMGMRTLAERGRFGLEAASKAIDRAEDAGILRRDYWGRKRDKPGAYVLFVGRALPEHNGSREAPEGKEGLRGEGFSTLSNAPSDRGVRVTRAPSDGVPELRWPKVVHTWEREDGKRRVVDSFYVARLGKKRGEIIRYLWESGGSASDAELLEAFGGKTTRARDFKSRMLGPIVADEIIIQEGETVSLSGDWREALEQARTRGDEQTDNKLQAERYAREREAFRKARTDGRPPDPTPELAGPERAAEIVAAAERRDHEARVEEQRRKVGTTPETFIADHLEGVTGFDWRELGELWRARGGKTADLWPVVRDRETPYRFAQREHQGDPLIVERREAEPVPINPDTVSRLEALTKPQPETPENLTQIDIPETAKPAPAAASREIGPGQSGGAGSPQNLKQPKAPDLTKPDTPEPVREHRTGPNLKDGIHHHGPLCGCELCEEPPITRYASAYAGSAS